MTNALPSGWNHAALRDCCASVKKVDPQRQPDEFFDYIDIGGVQPATGRIESTKRLQGRDAPSRARQKVRAGDILLSTVRTYQRKTAIVPDWLDGAIASTGFSVLRPRRGIDPRFMLHQLLMDDFVDRLSEKQTGTSYPAVRDGDVRAMSIRIAPEMEQRHIADAIDEHLSRLDAIEAGLASATQRAERFLERVVDEQLRLAAANSQSLGDLLTGRLVNGRSVPTAADSGHPVLRLTAIKDGLIDPGESKLGDFGGVDPSRFAISPDDFLVSRGNGSLKLVGRGGLVQPGSPPVAFPDTMIRVRVDESKLNPKFLSLVWNGRPVRRQLESQARTTAGIYKINQSMIAAVELPVPPLATQHQLTQAVDEAGRAVAACSKSMHDAQTRTAAIRRSILSQAFTGELVR